MPENRPEISRFVLFLTKNQLKKKLVPYIKYRYVCENCPSIILAFPWNWSEISRVVLFLHKKTSQKQDDPIIKHRYVLKNLSFYYIGFSLKIGLKSHVLFFFDQKLVKSTRCTWHKIPLRFMKMVVLLYWLFPENWSEISRFVLFLDKKRSKKQDVSIIKNRYVLQK